MKLIRLIAVLAILLWTFLLRSMSVLKHANKGNQIVLAESLSPDGLYQKVKNELQYPDIKNIFYNEHRLLSIAGRYTIYTLLQDGNVLSVCPVMTEKRNKDMRRAEEAMCITAYLAKVFNPATPINPYRMYKKMRHARRNSLIITVILVVALVLYSTVLLAPVLDETAKVKEAYLTQYSSEITVGEAFNGFFENPEWTSYQEGSQELIDFQGSCLVDNESAVVRITFGIYGDQFSVDSVKINGTEISDLLSASLFSAIYEQTDGLAYDDVANSEDAMISDKDSTEVDSTQFPANADSDDASAVSMQASAEVDIDSQALIVDHINNYFSSNPDYAFCQLTECTYQGDGTIIARAVLYNADRSYFSGAFLIDENNLSIISEIQAEEAFLN